MLVEATLVLFRVSGLMLVAPVLSSRSVPAMTRSALVILVTVLLVPAAAAPEGLVVGPGALATELVVGLGIGIGAATLLAGAELAGEVLAVQTGLSGATALDPISGQGTGVLSQLLQLFAVLMLLVSGGHLVMIDALASSFQAVPVGSSLALDAGALELVRSGGLLFAHGLQFAAPIIAAASVGYIALGVLAKASPQLNMLAVAFPLQIALGLLVLAGLLPLVATSYALWPERIASLVDRFLGSLVTG
jgi:flagellar biosynthetic protein FliR